MKIQEIAVGKVKIPLKKAFKTALRVATHMEDIIIKVVADNGMIGYGTAAPTAVITGDTQGSVLAAIRDCIAPKVIGLEVDRLDIIMHSINGAAVRNYSAKAAVDMAVYDLFAQKLGTPLYKLLGGHSNEVTTDITISVNSPEEMARDAMEAVNEGFTELKIKVGTDAAMDVERVRAIRDAVGYEVKLRVDANQGWGAKEAIRTIRTFEDLGFEIELVEQPVKAHDLTGLKYVTENVATDILADEAVFSAYDAFAVLSMRAADLINIKLMKSGGLYNAIRIADMAEMMNVQCMVGCMMESAVGVTAAASFAAARSIVNRTDLDAPILAAENPVIGGAQFLGNRIVLSEGAGAGISGIEGWEEVLRLGGKL